MAAEVYMVYKVWHGSKTLITCCDTPTEAAIAIEVDMEQTDDNARYEMIKEDARK